MQAKKAVKINHTLPRDGDAGAHVVIRLLAVRNDNIQPISGAALEEHDQPFCARSSGLSGIHRARKKAWNHAGAHNGQRAVLEENSAGNRHQIAPKSPPRMTQTKTD